MLADAELPERRAIVKLGRRSHRCSSCRCSRRRADRRHSSSTARRCGRSPTSRSSWCRTSPPRPSSPSRTRGCSTNCANRCSSRPPPPTCSRSSAARPSICSRCSTRWSKSAARLCEADTAIICPREGDVYRWPRIYGVPPSIAECMRTHPDSTGRGTRRRPRAARRHERSTFPTFWPIPNTR